MRGWKALSKIGEELYKVVAAMEDIEDIYLKMLKGYKRHANHRGLVLGR